MSTCPHCHGHLTEGHKCPRTRTSIAIELLLIALVGGLAAIAFVAILDPAQLTIDLDGLVLAGGAIFALAVHQLLAWRSKR